MSRVWRACFACVVAFSAPVVAREATPLVLSRGERVGVLSLLDAEVTHFHAAKALQDAFLKTQRVNWSVDGMLAEALKERVAQMGLVLVPLAVTDELDRSRENCFLNGNFNKSLPKECVLPLQHLAAAERVQGLIVLAPGLNNPTHAGSSRRKDLPEYVRGWGFITGEVTASGAPTLFSMTEMLLVAPSGEGPQLRGREWGGNFALDWTNFVAPADPKAIPTEAYAQLQPLFASILSRQSARLLEQLRVGP
jgi:hypothetical protein